MKAEIVRPQGIVAMMLGSEIQKPVPLRVVIRGLRSILELCMAYIIWGYWKKMETTGLRFRAYWGCSCESVH